MWSYFGFCFVFFAFLLLLILFFLNLLSDAILQLRFWLEKSAPEKVLIALSLLVALFVIIALSIALTIFVDVTSSIYLGSGL